MMDVLAAYGSAIAVASKAPDKPTFDYDRMTPAQLRDVWPDLRRFLSDAPSEILQTSIFCWHYDETARSERFRIAQGKRALRDEMRLEKPR